VADLLHYAVQGIPMGCVFALLAVGLVLTFKTSGVFNLAFAAQAYTSAAVFYVVRKRHQWPLLPAALLAIFIVGPLVGLLFDRLLFRHLRAVSSGAKLVTSLGLLVAVPEIVKLWFGNGPQSNPPPLWWVKRTDQFLWPQGSRFVLDAGQIATISSVVIVMVVLTLLFRSNGLGLQMRAVVESPRMVELNGINASRVASLAWMLSSALAGLAGVLLAPLFAALNSLDFFTLLVAALAATVLARLVNIPLAFLGGLLLGVLQAILAGELPTNSVLSNGLRPALPFIVLFGLLLLRPGLGRIRDVPDPLSGVDPPPASESLVLRTPQMERIGRAMTVAGVALGVLVALTSLNAYWLGLVITGVVLSIILLSITLLTGLGGMVSLCQPTFAAIGAFTTAQLVANQGFPVLLAALVGAGLAALIGALLAVPVLRLDGVYLALATLAFALMFQNILVPLSWVSGGSVPLKVPRPLVASVDFANDKKFFLLAVALLLVVAYVVARIKRGTTGLYLSALRGSEHAAASIGVSALRARVIAFSASAGIAGLGGGVLAMYYRQANFDQSFQFYVGLVWVVLVVTIGARSIRAAVVAGLLFFLMPEWLNGLFEIPQRVAANHAHLPLGLTSVLNGIDPTWAAGVSFILFGVGALTYARHPEGVLEANVSRFVSSVSKLRRAAPVPAAAEVAS
jgi:branched-chain amino acid transport system permease protein